MRAVMRNRGGVAAALVALAALLEAAAAAALISNPARPDTVGFVVAHGAACVLAAELYHLLPPAYQQGEPLVGKLFVTTFVLVVPGFGLLGLAAVVFSSLRRPIESQRRTWRRVAIPPLPAGVAPDSHARAHGVPANGAAADDTALRACGLIDVLESDAHADERVAAVMAVRQLRGQAAVPILRVALRDPCDDVRLLAFSMLDQRDKALDAAIQRYEAMLERAEATTEERAEATTDERAEATTDERAEAATDDRVAAHRALAQLHWEQVYTGLAATGAARSRALECARDHAQTALALAADPSTALLLGRVLLEQGDGRAAESALARARAHGIDDGAAGPFLAEAAFLQRDFDRVRGYLAAGGGHQGVAAELRRFWLGERA